jgi:FkbM family methyltransferase
LFTIHGFFPDISIRVCDIGASPIEGNLEPYRQLVDGGIATVIGFEPNLAEWRKFKQRNTQATVQCLPYAIGDGKKATLHQFEAAGMASLLQPNSKLLKFFPGFDLWCQPRGQTHLTTRRLDDLREELGAVDYLKLDVQGSELPILENATKTLENVLVIHTEVPFLPLYLGQPLFGDIDAFLVAHGFMLHCFANATNRQFVSLPDGAPEQVLEADAVYVKDFSKWDDLSAASLKKVAVILHELYGSCGLAAMALSHLDDKIKTKLYSRYTSMLRGAK